MLELQNKYRPVTWKQVIGQDDVVRMLKTKVRASKVPHALLFSGPSGCGKTTLARILKIKLGCGKPDFHEVNCADFRGIDMVREIRSRVPLAPIHGKCRIWLIDECHQMSSQAQNAMLKLLEDAPSHVYFMLATTDPQKLLRTIRTRCTDILVKLLPYELMVQLVKRVAKLEKIKLSEEVLEKLVEVADGSARKGLVLLNSVQDVKGSDKKLNIIQGADSNRDAIELARALLSSTASWKKIAELLKGIQEEPESLRWMVLGHANSIMMSPRKKMWPRAMLIIENFSDNYYDSKKAGLVKSCWDTVQERKALEG